MPRIPDSAIESVFFLYKSEEDAKNSEDPGGSGFLVQTGSRLSDNEQFFGVTNWHVAVEAGCSCIRLQSGKIFAFDASDWSFVPNGPDVAAVSLKLDSGISALHEGQFLKEHEVKLLRIGVGDDVFMLGLFVDHSGDAGLPAARFGQVSMMPGSRAPIEQPTGHRGPSFIIDLHSRDGFSGSPVFVYRTLGSDLTNTRSGHIDPQAIAQAIGIGNTPANRDAVALQDEKLLKVLGIHWAQFTEHWELTSTKSGGEAKKPLQMDDQYVKGFSGMTLTIPAWEILPVIKLASR